VRPLLDEKGSAVVEMAIALPIVVVAMLGLIDVMAIVSAKRSIDSSAFIMGEAVRYNRNFDPSANQSVLWDNIFYPSLGGLAQSNAQLRITRVSFIDSGPTIEWSIANAPSAAPFELGSINAADFSDGSSVYIVDSSYTLDRLLSPWLGSDFSVTNRKIHAVT